MRASPDQASGYPDNPVIARLWRGSWVESQHRGAWVLVDSTGEVLDGKGGFEEPFFARSALKSLQALPLIETGAAEHYGYTDAELALALASHNGEALHTEGVGAILERLDLAPSDLQCGPQPPFDPSARAALAKSGSTPTALHNNCSGKHAGFLALARHLGCAPEHYLDSKSEPQTLVRAAVADMTGVPENTLGVAIDGCSAPTFRLPLTALATAFARVATPAGLGGERRAACERMQRAVATHPVHLAGRHKRLCTALAAACEGRFFPKIGGEAVYAIGIRGADRGLAVKVDDGNTRGLNHTVAHLLERLGFLAPGEGEELDPWRSDTVLNWAGRAIGRLEVVI